MRTAVRPRKAAATVPQAGCLDQPRHPTLAQRFISTTFNHSSLLRRGVDSSPGFDGSRAESYAGAHRTLWLRRLLPGTADRHVVASAGVNGSSMAKVVPSPTVLATVIRPPWAVTIALVMFRPSPPPGEILSKLRSSEDLVGERSSDGSSAGDRRLRRTFRRDYGGQC